MNNIYVIILDKVDYDEYAGWVVIAKNEEEAKQLCKIKKENTDYYDNKFEANIESIENIGKSKRESQIVLSDFKAG